MITLKKHYAISTAVQVTGILIILSSNAKGKDGKYIFTPEGKNNLLNIGTGFAAVGGVLHWAGHARVIGRFGKYISNKVGSK